MPVYFDYIADYTVEIHHTIELHGVSWCASVFKQNERLKQLHGWLSEADVSIASPKEDVRATVFVEVILWAVDQYPESVPRHRDFD
jgi:hypothetical protein